MKKLLLVENEPDQMAMFVQALMAEGLKLSDIIQARNPSEAHRAMETEGTNVGLLATDYELATGVYGTSIIEIVRIDHPGLPCILMSKLHRTSGDPIATALGARFMQKKLYSQGWLRMFARTLRDVLDQPVGDLPQQSMEKF